jgi:hypothetical protein
MLAVRRDDGGLAVGEVTERGSFVKFMGMPVCDDTRLATDM